jgi:HPt (histidine-containing phosphotransfer) domain-containing protein
VIIRQFFGTEDAPMIGTEGRSFVGSAAHSPLLQKDLDTVFASAASLPPAYLAVLRHQADAIPELIAEIRKGLGTADLYAVENAAHKLKTNCATFGARQMSAIAQAIENLAPDGDAEEISRQVTEIDALHTATAPVIRRLLQGLREYSPR